MLYNLTGSKSRFKQAEFLATQIYEQTRAETVMSYFTPDKNELKSQFYANTRVGLEARAKKLHASETRIQQKRSVAAALASQTVSVLTGGGSSSATAATTTTE